MPSIFKRPNRVARLGRNGFDMSQRRIFTCPCGMLLPTYTDFLNPGDSVKVNAREYIRTQPLQSAAFVRLKAHVDWFFVPVTQMYSQWNQFFNNTDDNMSSIFLHKSTPVFPTLAPSFANGFLPSSTNYYARTSVVAGEANLTVDEFGVPLVWNARRLFMMLYSNDAINTNHASSAINPLSLLAYHKCFHSHYRNTDYTPNDPESYNIDQFYTDAVITKGSTFEHKLFKVHYRPWRRDLYSFIQPAPIFGNSFASYLQDFPKDSSDSYDSYFPESSGGASLSVSSQTPTTPNPNDPVGYLSSRVGVNFNPKGDNSISVGDIRAAFALDKLLRITAQTGSHYDEQTLAHFGYKMPEGISDEAYFLGSQSLDININEVVATASTGSGQDTSTLGDIAGRGFGASQDSRDIKFTAPCHGVLIAIHSIEPIPDYRSIPDPIAKYKNSFDFYHPEFDNIGMQPYGLDFSTNSSPADIIGWQYRYMDHKSKLDISDESIYGTSLRTWALSRSSVYYTKDLTVDPDHPDNPDYIPNPVSVPLSGRFYIMPQYTNGVFLSSFPAWNNPDDSASGLLSYVISDGSGWKNPINQPQNIYGDDPFICVLDHKVYKTSVMSVYSLPRM